MSGASADSQNLRHLTGYHHMTMVTSDARSNARFYTGVLRLRMVKKTVNFDMPETYHLYYGDATGSPGTLLTFFEWPGAGRGQPGWGGTRHIALGVASGAALAFWSGHLEREGVDVEGPFDDHGCPTIRFHDPDGLILELSAPEGEDVPDGAPALFVPEMAIGPLRHVAIQATNRDAALIYYRDLLGFDMIKQGPHPDDPSWTDIVFGLSDDPDMRLIATIVDREGTQQAQMGAGQTHHIAFGVEDDSAELAWQERILNAGVPVSEVRDRSYFHSVYFNDPDGHLLEIATANPGFAIDEPFESLGERLSLPPWLEPRREQLERSLTPLA